jgi:hypothetical protein
VTSARASISCTEIGTSFILRLSRKSPQLCGVLESTSLSFSLGSILL